MTRDINELLPVVKEKCQAFLEVCKLEGLQVVVTGTYRSFAEQDALYARGRTTAGPIVTNAKGGQSDHNWRVAFDCVPVVGGVTVYNDDRLWAKIGRIGASVGLEWGGNWIGFNDKPHFQYMLGYTWQDFLAGTVDLSKFNTQNMEPTQPEVKEPEGTVHRVIVDKETGQEYKVIETDFGNEDVIFKTQELGNVVFSNVGKLGNLLNDKFDVKEV